MATLAAPPPARPNEEGCWWWCSLGARNRRSPAMPAAAGTEEVGESDNGEKLARLPTTWLTASDGRRGGRCCSSSILDNTRRAIKGGVSKSASLPAS